MKSAGHRNLRKKKYEKTIEGGISKNQGGKEFQRSGQNVGSQTHSNVGEQSNKSQGVSIGFNKVRVISGFIKWALSALGGKPM